MEEYQRHKRLFSVLQPLARTFLRLRYGVRFDTATISEPTLIICNHVTNFDPIYLGACLKDCHTYFVASEHLLRLGFLTCALLWVTGFIPQKKGNNALATVKSCLKHIKQGHSVAIFAEGNTCWDGITDHIFPATGKLAKMSGTGLATFRIEGAYLSSPRWRKGIRRGRIYIHPVNTYTPEQLKAWSFEEINEVIEKDIHTNIWEDQESNPVRYSGSKRAEGLERAMFICPECRKIGTLHSKGNAVFCDCGFTRELDAYGTFTVKEPFPTIHEWDVWQKEELAKLAQMCGTDGLSTVSTDDTNCVSTDAPFFEDEHVTLYRIESDHEQQMLCEGTLSQFADRLELGEYIFPKDQLDNMAIVNTKRLLFTCGKEYYEASAQPDACVRKYFLFNTNNTEM